MMWLNLVRVKERVEKKQANYNKSKMSCIYLFLSEFLYCLVVGKNNQMKSVL